MPRATLFHAPPLTLGRVARAPGVLCEWTLGLAPIGERRVVPGQLVELHARIDASAGEIAADAAVGFDVIPADAAGQPQGTVLVSLRAGGGSPASGAPAQPRSAHAAEPAGDQDASAVRAAFVSEHPDDLDAQLLVVRGEDATDLLTWWRVDPGAGQALHFALDVAGVAGPSRTTQPLQVETTPSPARTLTFELRGEDDGPMADAELEAAFEGGQRARATTGADGRASVELPAGASPVFRLFLLSYVERAGEPGPGPQPEPPDRPVIPARVDRRPEVVAAFAFDSAFPAPAVHAALERVRTKAGADLDVRLVVFGHTDAVGSDAYNVGLSERRARAVLALLLDDQELFEAVATAEGWDTRVHQSMLRGVGCDPGAIDGQAGALTRTATASFQREYNAGVYHERAVGHRARPTLTVDGELGPATRRALRDAYVAVAPHVRSDRFADPPFDGCGEAHLVSERDDENRRAVVAFLPADVDLTQSSACERYAELVSETPEDRRAPRFSDHQWLLEEAGTLHLSAATAVPDGTAARIRVVRCDCPPPLPPPDSSGGSAVPELGETVVELPAEIQGGVCAARWAQPDLRLLDPEAWVVDHDVALEIAEPEDHEAPAEGDPASGRALLEAVAVLPPVFVLEAGESWGVSAPPSARLERLRFASDGDAAEEGLAIRPDGALVRFTTDDGLTDPERPADVMSLVVIDHAVEEVA